MLLKRGDGKFSHWERNRMTISEKIFELLRERGMTQKEFAQATGIAESSISDWKRKKTNPVSEKILI
jgi:transcriptional regulator with XRE-family HTH domain